MQYFVIERHWYMHVAVRKLSCFNGYILSKWCYSVLSKKYYTASAVNNLPYHMYMMVALLFVVALSQVDVPPVPCRIIISVYEWRGKAWGSGVGWGAIVYGNRKCAISDTSLAALSRGHAISTSCHKCQSNIVCRFFLHQCAMEFTSIYCYLQWV